MIEVVIISIIFGFGLYMWGKQKQKRIIASLLFHKIAHMEIIDAFNWTKNTGFNFRKLLVTNGTALSGKFSKEHKLSRNNQMLENFW